MSVNYADGSYFGGNVATEIGENVFNPGGGTGGDGAFVGEGVRSGIDSWDKAYTNAGGTLPARFGLSDLKQFALDNKSWLAGAGETNAWAAKLRSFCWTCFFVWVVGWLVGWLAGWLAG